MEVNVYTKPGCQGCRLTILQLAETELPFSVRPLDDDTLKAAEAQGITAAPVVRAGDDMWGGFRPDRIAALRAAA